VTSVPTPKRNSKLTTLQGGRAVAAVLVVLYHLNGAIFGKPNYYPEQFSPLFRSGDAGVYFFFVLSGFIIAHVHWHQIGASGTALDYLRKRAIRIYPIYWVILAPITLAFFLVPAASRDIALDVWSIASSVLLTPTADPSIISVAWTLRHEVLFYGLFAVLILHRATGLGVLGAWMLGSIVALAWPITGNWGVIFSPLHLLFALGVAAAAIVRRTTLPAPGWILAAGAVGFFAYAIGPQVISPRFLVYGIASTLMIVGLVELERSGRVSAPAPLLLLGDASYAIYLVHLPAMSVGAKVIFKLGLDHTVPAAVIFVGLLGAAVGAGVLAHLLIERPLLALSRPKRTLQPVQAMS